MGKLILYSAIALVIPPTSMALMALLFTFDMNIVRASFLSREMWLLGNVMGITLFIINYLRERL